MCEPLKGKREKYKSYNTGNPSYDEGVSTGYESAMENIKSAVEGFLKDIMKHGKFERNHIHTTEVRLLVNRWFEDVIE